MRQGKLTNEQLERLVFGELGRTRPEVVQYPEVGVDCAALRLGDALCVLSTDPITAAGSGIGALAVNVCCNDAAAMGAEPVAMLATLLLPPCTAEEEIAAIVRDMERAAAEIGVDIIGGHTEITGAVVRPVLSGTVIAKAPPGGLLTPRNIRPGDAVLLTKWAGMEGTAIIAADCADVAGDILCGEEIVLAAALAAQASVAREGALAAKAGARAMHDVTEGGVLGAAWEMARASGYGMALSSAAIPVQPVTRKLAGALGLDPLKLVSSGCMLIVCEEGEAMLSALAGAGISAAVIGRVEGDAVLCDGKRVEPPEEDELIRFLSAREISRGVGNAPGTGQG